MNPTKPKTVFDELEQLRRQLAATEAALTEVQRGNAELRAELGYALEDNEDRRRYDIELRKIEVLLTEAAGCDVDEYSATDTVANLIAQNERMRRVCEAAVAYNIATSARALADQIGADYSLGARHLLACASGFACDALLEAVAEYRKQQEEANDAWGN